MTLLQTLSCITEHPLLGCLQWSRAPVFDLANDSTKRTSSLFFDFTLYAVMVDDACRQLRVLLKHISCNAALGAGIKWCGYVPHVVVGLRGSFLVRLNHPVAYGTVNLRVSSGSRTIHCLSSTSAYYRRGNGC